MKAFSKSNMVSALSVAALVAGFNAGAAMVDHVSGAFGVERQKIEQPQDGKVERRPNGRIEQPNVERSREPRGERRPEGREERRDERREERRADREREHRMERIEHRQERRVYRQPVWRGDIRYFDRDDGYRWRGGAWRYARHEGRVGWWWVVGSGSWYFYPEPVYPYPDPYIPPVVVTQPRVVEVAPEIVVAPATAATSPSWYFCESTNGYYPYTPTCPEGWKTVPATPPVTPAK